jgi:hypothetical protein
MKKLLIAFAGILLGAASLAILPGGAAGPAPELSKTVQHNIYPKKGAPSALYGYVTVEDTAKRLYYVGDPNTPFNWSVGVPMEVHLSFQPAGSSTGREYAGTMEKEYILKFTHNFSPYFIPNGGPRGQDPRDVRNLGGIPNALAYNIPFVTANGGGAFPIYNQFEKKVYYDAKRWQFMWIDVPSITWQETSAAGITAPVILQLGAHDKPIRDFPDPPGHGSRTY